MPEQSTEAQSDVSSQTTWLIIGAASSAFVAVALGLVTHSEGTVGHGGVECGSVWSVKAYHSGCGTWLDDMSRVVFAAAALSFALLLTMLVRRRGGLRVALGLSVFAGLAIVLLGPWLLREAVFLDFGY